MNAQQPHGHMPLERLTHAIGRLTALFAAAALITYLVESRAAPLAENSAKPIRVGIIGLDTSHVLAFTKLLNDPDASPDLAGCPVVAAYPKGSKDIQSSVSRVPSYTEQIRELGVDIVESIPGLLERVDAVLLESNDGRPHLRQVLPVLKAGRPVFIDKPLAGSLSDAIAIFEEAKRRSVPVFSSSSLRYGAGTVAARRGDFGRVIGCETFSPCVLESTHPDLFWYGIHGVESLFTVMGTGCQTVTRVHTTDSDVVVGVWRDGRVGTFRGMRSGKQGYGGRAYCETTIADVGKSDGYRPLVVDIVKFFRSGVSPVSEDETLEIYAFMEAADESKRSGGRPVSVANVLEKARAKLVGR